MKNKELEILINLLMQIKTKDEMRNFLLGLLTQSEIEEFARRIDIVTMLKRGVGQHEIAKKMKVGVATVTRGSKEIKLGRFQIIK